MNYTLLDVDSQISNLEYQKEKLLNILEPFNPVPSNNSEYIKLDCPSCKQKHKAYVKTKYGLSSYISCNRANNCNFSKQVYKYFNIPTKQLSITESSVAALFESHGIDIINIRNMNLVDAYGSINIIKHEGNILQKKIKFFGGKYRYILPKDTTKNIAEMYPCISPIDQTKTLYVLEGDWDWFKATEDGLCCTSSLHGCKTRPTTEQGLNVFLPFKHIKVCYDNDTAGIKYASSLARYLAEKFPQKIVSIVTLPFTQKELKEENLNDYCDFRKKYSLEAFLQIEPVVTDIKKTKAEKKLEKMNLAFEELKQKKSEVTMIDNDEIIKKIPFEEEFFIVRTSGIYMTKTVIHPQTKDILVTEKHICSDAVLVDSRLVDICSNKSSVKLSWNSDSGYKKEKIVPTKLLWTKNMDELTDDTGLRIFTDNTTNMSKYFRYALDSAKEDTFSTRNGWIKDRFILGDTAITSSGEEQSIYRSGDNHIKLGSEGKHELWCDTVLPFLAADPQTQIICGMSAIAPFLKDLGLNSFSLHVYGDSSRGKTISSFIASSFWGQPDSVMHDWSGSAVAHELYFHTMKNIPCFLEECQETAHHIIKKTMYQFGNGRGKARGTKNVTLAAQKDWLSVCVSTGEARITDTTPQGGLAARVLEIHKRVFAHITPDKFTKLKRILKENFGYAGKALIKYFLQNKEKVIDNFEMTLEEIFPYCKNSNLLQTNIHERVLPYWCAIIIGCKLNQELFGFPYAATEIWRELTRCFEEMENAKPADNLAATLTEIFLSNKKKFNIRNTAGFVESLENKILGLYESDLEVVHFLPDFLRKELLTLGYSFSMLSLLKDTDRLILQKGRGLKNRVKISPGKSYTNCISFRLNITDDNSE